MEGSCARAVEIGLPSIAFTEHADFTLWSIPPDGIATMPEEFRAMVRADGLFEPPRFDVVGYAACLDRCREQFPGLRILSGVELGEPHWHQAEVDVLIGSFEFDRILGSVHSITDGAAALVVDRSFACFDADVVVRSYLAEVLKMVRSSDRFSILAHIDYPLRAWPTTAGHLTLNRYEDEFRAVLTELAASGRALELNTRLPMAYTLLTWWRQAGGRTLSFGSDAHDPAELGQNILIAANMARAASFRPSDFGLWTCV